jgi:hypothetical protein
VNLPSRVPPGALVRGGGVALACLVPSVTRRSRLIATSYGAAWPLDRPGLQFFTLVPDEDEEPWRRAVMPVLTSGASWTVVMTVATLAARRSRLPLPVAAAVLGTAVALGDTTMVGMAERMRATAAAQVSRGPQATPDPAAPSGSAPGPDASSSASPDPSAPTS